MNKNVKVSINDAEWDFDAILVNKRKSLYEPIEPDSFIRINLVNLKTGEIRQKAVNVDFVVRRALQSEIRRWKGRGEHITKSNEEQRRN